MSERRRQRRRRRSRSRDRNGRKAGESDAAPERDPERDLEREGEKLESRDAADGSAPAAEPSSERLASERQTEPRSEPRPEPQTDGEPVLETRRETPVETSESLAEDPEDPEAFGRWLRRQRELRGVELQAIAESSKISLTYLRALEDGRFGLLPAEIFAKGFVDQYARFVGFDPEEAVNFYLVAKQHRQEEEDALLEVAEPPPESSGLRWVVAALVLAALCLGVVWLLATLGTDSDASDATDSTVSDSAAAEATVAEETPDRSGDEGESTDAAGIAPPEGAADAEPTAESAAESTAEADAGTISSPRDASPSLAPLRVVVDFTDSCWVSAREDGGDTLQKLFTQGESLILEAERYVDLRVGNHRSAVVEVNGMPYDLAAAGRGNRLVRDIRIDLQTAERLQQATREQGP